MCSCEGGMSRWYNCPWPLHHAMLVRDLGALEIVREAAYPSKTD